MNAKRLRSLIKSLPDDAQIYPMFDRGAGEIDCAECTSVRVEFYDDGTVVVGICHDQRELNNG